MSSSSPFDTLKFSTRLKEGGFTPEQAEVLTLSIQEALTATVATKADLAPIQARLEHVATKTDIAELRAEIAAAYRMMAVFAFTFIGTIIGATIALIRYLAP